MRRAVHEFHDDGTGDLFASSSERLGEPFGAEQGSLGTVTWCLAWRFSLDDLCEYLYVCCGFSPVFYSSSGKIFSGHSSASCAGGGYLCFAGRFCDKYHYDYSFRDERAWALPPLGAHQHGVFAVANALGRILSLFGTFECPLDCGNSVCLCWHFCSANCIPSWV